MTETAGTAVSEIDPITNEVLRNSLINIVGNMENGMLRTAFSLVARDLRDIACGIHTGPDEGLELAAVACGVPILSVVTHFGLRENLLEFGIDSLGPGDEIIFNDPYRGGNHAPDVTVARPVFDDEGLLGFCTTRSHWVDVGGIPPGSWPVGGGVRTIMEETSLRLPPMLLYRHNVAVKSTHSLILDGTRAPVLVLGDLRAQHTANLIGERELLELAKRYGRDTVIAAMHYTLDYGERRMRAAISRVPDGEYTAADTIDDDGVNKGPYTLKCKLTVRGDQAELDFSGSDRMTEGNASSPWGMSAACAQVALRGLLDPTLSANGGVFRPVNLILPAGSLVHVLPYHACADGNGTVSVRVESVLIKLVNQAMPAQAIGDSYSAASVSNFGGYEDSRNGRISAPWILFHVGFSGWGATEYTDGQSYSQLSLSNCIDPAIEAMEQDIPVIFTMKEFTPDSGGPGLHRGGMGTVYGIGFLEDGQASNSTERVTSEGFGVAGGKGSQRTILEVSTGIDPAIRAGLDRPTRAVSGTYQQDGQEIFLTGKFLGKPVVKDDVWYKYVPGGGGWGDPLAHDAQSVATDVQNGLVSIDGAHDDYGVIVDADGHLNPDQTTTRRAALAHDPDFKAKVGPTHWSRRPYPTGHTDNHESA